MKRSAYMEYQLNDTRSHVIRREHRVRNPVEVGIEMGDHKVALEAFINGGFELCVDGVLVYEGKLS